MAAPWLARRWNKLNQGPSSGGPPGSPPGGRGRGGRGGGRGGGGGNGGGGDASYDDVTLLLHGDGTDGSTTFTDDGPDNRTPETVQGGVEIDTAQQLFGTGSILFNGSDSGLRYSHVVLNPGAGDFTIEAAVRLASVGTAQSIAARWDTNSNRSFLLRVQTDGTILFNTYVSTDGNLLVSLNSTSALSADTWYRIAADRVGDDWKLYIDGDVEDSATQSGTINTSTTNHNQFVTIGNRLSDREWLDGWLDEVRFTVGTGRYGGAYTPASEPFPNSA